MNRYFGIGTRSALRVWLRSLGVCGLLVATPGLAAEQALTPPAGLDKAEVEAFEATVSRYSSRMNEFRDEAKVMVDRQEALERAELNQSYDAVLGQLQNDDDSLRTTAIRRFEAFLGQYPEARHSAHVMFRLSELYFEKSEEAYEDADVAFQVALDKLDEGGDFEDIPDEPVKDYAPSIGLHTQIIERFPEYEYLPGSYYMLGYMLREPNSAQLDEAGAQEWFRALVTDFPDSEFTSRAHLRLGDYHFEYNELDTAIPHYRKVVELEGVNGPLYDDGLYKLAWTYYRLSQYDEALGLLAKLLDWSATVWEPKKGRESATVPEAVEYIAISLADLAHDRERSPLRVAQTFFGPGSDGAYEARVYKKLADVLSKQANYEEAIEVYEHFQDRWPYDPDNPVFQQKIARLHMTKLPPDRVAADDAIAALNERFNDSSAWWRANRNNPDALSVARGFIEESLSAVAVNAHTLANETGSPSDYLRAASLYGDYLQKFPFAADYYEIQWYYSQVLQKGGDLDSAEREYLQLRKGGEHPYKESALYRLRMISLMRVVNTYESLESRDPSSPVAKEITTESGPVRQVYELGKLHQELVSRTDELVTVDFGSTIRELELQIKETKDRDVAGTKAEILKEVEDYATAFQDNRAALDYQAGQVYFAHGNFEEARTRLAGVVEAYPDTENGCFAADLDARTYLADDDLVGYRQKVAYYMSLNLCQQDGLADSDDSFGTKLEQVDFELAARTAKSGDFLGAAEAFVVFYQKYPNSEYRKKALQNAANNFERGGRLDDSIRMLEKYVTAFPDDEISRSFLFRLAGVYAQALDLDRAIESYEELYERTKNSEAKDAPIALANAAYLRVGVGDFEGAARNYEKFGASFPNQPDTEKQVFQAGEQWERVGDREAIAFYRRYLADYRGLNPDHEMAAVYKLAVLAEKSGGRDRGVESLWEDVLATYTRLLPTGKVSVLGRHYAAHAEFRNLEDDLTAFKDVKFGSNDTKNAEILVSKADELVAIESRAAALVSNYQDFEYGTGALYVIGETYLAYADMLFEAPPPRGLDEEEVMLYEEVIAERRVPLEDKGKARLVRVLEKAKEARRWSQFQTKALAMLNERFPREYAPEKEEVRGKTSAFGVKRAGPVPLQLDPESNSAGENEGGQ
jgi:tetratricopeptide (TPR) repeat protein